MIVNKHEINIRLIQLHLDAERKALTLIPQIIEVVKKFDGKAPSKRFDTALKKVDKNLVFNMTYNSFVIEMYIENRYFLTGEKAYYIHPTCNIVRSSITSGYGDGICQDGIINAERLIAWINRAKESTEVHIEKTSKALTDIDNILARKAEIEKMKSEFIDNTPYLIRQYFDLKV